MVLYVGYPGSHEILRAEKALQVIYDYSGPVPANLAGFQVITEAQLATSQRNPKLTRNMSMEDYSR